MLQLLQAAQNSLIHGPHQLRVALGEPPALSLSFGGLFLLELGWLAFATIIIGATTFLLPVHASSRLPILFAACGYLFHSFYSRYLLTSGNFTKSWQIQIPALLLQSIGWLWIMKQGSQDMTFAWTLLAISFTPSLLLAGIQFPRNIFSFIPYRYLIRKHWNDGKWLLFSTMLHWWAFHILVVAAGWLLGVEVMGAMQMALLVWAIVLPLMNALESELMRQATIEYKQSPAAAINYLWEVTTKTGWIILLFGGGLMFFSKEIFSWAGGEAFSEYSFVLQGISLVYLMILLSSPLRVALRLLQQEQTILRSYYLTLICSILMAYWIIGNFQLKGILIVLLINQALMIWYWAQRLKKITV
jgi:O-antigen/teichoic acid export membrane protein